MGGCEGLFGLILRGFVAAELISQSICVGIFGVASGQRAYFFNFLGKMGETALSTLLLNYSELSRKCFIGIGLIKIGAFPSKQC